MNSKTEDVLAQVIAYGILIVPISFIAAWLYMILLDGIDISIGYWWMLLVTLLFFSAFSVFDRWRKRNKKPRHLREDID